MTTQTDRPIGNAAATRIQLCLGYTKEQCADGIIIYRFQMPATGKVVSNACADAWFADVVAVFAQARAADTWAGLLYDARSLNMPTPYILQRAQELARIPLPKDWWVATLVRSQFAADIINFIRTASLSLADQTKRSLVFQDEYEALAWLRRRLPTPGG